MRDAEAACWTDPGETTGIAVWFFRTRQFWCDQRDFRGTGGYIEALAQQSRPLLIGCEAYAITPGSHVRHDGSALMVTGMIRWLAFRHGASMLPSQPPSARRLGLRHLKTLGWYRPGRGHAMDAAGHLATWMISQRLLPEELRERIVHGDGGDR